jgi:hypothetical protein
MLLVRWNSVFFAAVMATDNDIIHRMISIPFNKTSKPLLHLCSMGQ